MNKNERKIFEKYEKLGYDVIKDGSPDIILLKDGKVEFVEVKFWKDMPNPQQIRAHKLLRKHGLSIKVERVPKVILSPLYKKLHGGK